MNEIFIRTHNIEYLPGDSVFGAVYLQINQETAGRDVILKLRGYESYKCHCESCVDSRSSSTNDPWEPVGSHGHAVQRMSYDYIVGSFDDGIPFGSYAFPFHLKILPDFPGTFHASFCDHDNNSFSVDVVCRLEASIINDDSVKTTADIFVHKPVPQSALSQVKIEPLRSSGFINKFMGYLEARLDPDICYSDEKPKLTINFTNNPVQPKIKSFAFELLRTVTTHHIVKSSTWHYSRDSINTVGEQEVPVGDEVREAVTVGVAKLTSGSADLVGSTLLNCIRNLVIPLDQCEPNALLCTASCSYIECSYCFDCTFKFTNCRDVKISVPIPAIRTRPPKVSVQEWMHCCEIKTSAQGPYSVSAQDLHGKSFAHLPSFQEL